MKPETKFRIYKVFPFLHTLKNGYFMSISQRGISGTPDILGCLNGRFIAIEIKAENGRLSRLQDRNLRKIRESGGLAFSVKPSDWELLKDLLTMYNRGESDGL